jgi:membrane protease YdiL (CAAX protease family)
MDVNRVQQTPGDDFAAQLRGFGLVGIVAIVLIMLSGNIVFPNMVAIPVGAVLVLLWARLSHTPLREIGYAKPRNWMVTILIGILFGVAFKFLMKAVMMPLLGADPINHAYHFLAGNKSMLTTAIVAMLIAGFGEETVFRGFMFERLEKLFGDSRGSKIFIVVFTSLLFGLSHYFSQGWPGVEQATITGLVFGTIFAAAKNIWLVMIAHAFFDLTALAMIYKNVESQIAHWIFK